MNEAYAVGIEISLGGNLGKVIAGMIEQFGQLDKAVQRTQGSVNQLASAMRVLARQAQAGATAFDSMASAAGRAASAAERAAKAGGSKWRDNVAGAAPAGGASPRPMLLLAPPGDTPRVAAPGAEPGRSLVPYQATPWGDANRPPIDVPWSHTQDQEAARTEARKREGGDMWLNAMAAGIGGAALAHTFDAAATVDSIQANLLSQHWTSQQVAQARQEAFDLQKKVVPSTVAGNMQIIADAFAIFNNAGEALKAAPGLVKAASSMHPGSAGDIDGILDALRTSELSGAIYSFDKNGKRVLDPKKMQAFLDQVVRADYASSGRLGPAQWYQFAKSAGVSGSMLDSSAFFQENIPVLLAMGAQRGGTAYRALSQQFTGGRMSQAAVKMLEQWHIITDPSQVVKNGIGQFLVKPGAMPTGVLEESREHPVEFVTGYLLPKVQKYLADTLGKKYTTASPEAKLHFEEGAMMQLASRLPAADLMTEFLRAAPAMAREVARFANMPGADQIYNTERSNNPQMALAGTEAAFNAAITALGQSAIKTATDALNAVTGALNKLTDWAQAHPKEAEMALEGLAGAVALFGASAAAGAALKLLTGPTGLFGLATGIEVLGHSMSAIPGWVVDMVAGAAAGYQVGGPYGAAAGGALGAGVGLYETYTGNYKSSLDAGAPIYGLAPGLAPGLGQPPMAPMPFQTITLPATTTPQGKTMAPVTVTAPPQQQGMGGDPTLGTPGNPIVVTVHGGNVSVSNGRDLLNGVASGIGDLTNRPDQGYIGAGDINTSPWAGALYNAIP